MRTETFIPAGLGALTAGSPQITCEAPLESETHRGTGQMVAVGGVNA